MAAYRYWGFKATDVAFNTSYPYFNSLWEIEFFLSADGSGTDLTAGKTAVASSYQVGYEASKAIDNNSGTRWASNNSSSVSDLIYVDLTTAQSVASASITGDAPYFAKKFMIVASNNATDWTNIKEYSTTSTSNKQVFSNIQTIKRKLINGGLVSPLIRGVLCR